MASMIHGLWREIARPAVPCVRLRIAAPAVMAGEWPSLQEAAQAARPRATLRPAAPLAIRPRSTAPTPAKAGSPGEVAVPRPRATLTPVSQARQPFPPVPPMSGPVLRGPVAVPRPPLLQTRGARPAMPTASLPLDQSTLKGAHRLPGSADSWTEQMLRCVLDASRLCCPEEYAPMSHISIEDVATWLNLLCRFPLSTTVASSQVLRSSPLWFGPRGPGPTWCGTTLQSWKFTWFPIRLGCGVKSPEGGTWRTTGRTPHSRYSRVLKPTILYACCVPSPTRTSH